MALKLKRDDTIVLNIVAQIPVGEEMVEDKFKLITIRTGLQELAGFKKDEALLRRVVKGWVDVVGDDGQPVPFNPENFEAFLSIPSVVQASAVKYMKTMNGVREGN